MNSKVRAMAGVVSVRVLSKTLYCSTTRSMSIVSDTGGAIFSPAAKNLFARNPNLSVNSILASGRSPSHHHVITKVECCIPSFKSWPLDFLFSQTFSGSITRKSQSKNSQADVMAALLAPVSPPKDVKQEIIPKQTESSPISPPAAGLRKLKTCRKGIATLNP